MPFRSTDLSFPQPLLWSSFKVVKSSKSMWEERLEKEKPNGIFWEAFLIFWNPYDFSKSTANPRLPLNCFWNYHQFFKVMWSFCLSLSVFFGGVFVEQKAVIHWTKTKTGISKWSQALEPHLLASGSMKCWIGLDWHLIRQKKQTGSKYTYTSNLPKGPN